MKTKPLKDSKGKQLYKTVSSLSSIYDMFRIPPEKDIDTKTMKINPNVARRKNAVEHFEMKLKADLIRKFDGHSEEQKKVLLDTIDNNCMIRKKANLGLAPEEDFEDDFFNLINEVPVLDVDKEIPQVIEISEFPIQEHTAYDPKIIDTPYDLSFLGDAKQEPKKVPLKEIYGKIIETDRQGKIPKHSTRFDLEQQAVSAMKMVSQDLQNWVVDVLQNSINLDPAVLQQVQELDEKYGFDASKKKDPIVVDNSDVNEFNVLLNACKPAILESRPLKKLDIISDTIEEAETQRPVSKQAKKKPHYGAWYIPVSQWNDCMMSSKETEKTETKKFAGIVQQKLDEIASKRESNFNEL